MARSILGVLLLFVVATQVQAAVLYSDDFDRSESTNQNQIRQNNDKVLHQPICISISYKWVDWFGSFGIDSSSKVTA